MSPLIVFIELKPFSLWCNTFLSHSWTIHLFELFLAQPAYVFQHQYVSHCCNEIACSKDCECSPYAQSVEQVLRHKGKYQNESEQSKVSPCDASVFSHFCNVGEEKAALACLESHEEQKNVDHFKHRHFDKCKE